jgi:hypothetical protein
MRVSEFIAWGAVIGVTVWGASVALADTRDKPVAACRPIVWASGLARDGLTAIKPGSSFETAGNRVREGAARWCLGYAANLFEVNKAPPRPANTGDQRL